jgi:hypothetical protein
MLHLDSIALPTRTLACMLALLAASACGRDGSGPPKPASPSSGAPAAMALPDGLVERGEPAGTHAAACKASARTGEEVTVLGRIGGSRRPFGAEAAVFTIVDPALRSCKDMGDHDHCRTPWDYCCEDRDAMKRGMVTIEVTDADGNPLPLGLEGVSGLEPLATVAVTGTVVEWNDSGAMVVRARRIVLK